MKIINLNESPEEYKAKYEDATSQKEKCDAAEAALNEVLGGLGTKIRNNFGDYFLNLFITKFD